MCLSGCGISPRTLPVVSVKPDRLKTSKRHCLTVSIPYFSCKVVLVNFHSIGFTLFEIGVMKAPPSWHVN